VGIGIGQGRGDKSLFFGLCYGLLRSAEVQIALATHFDEDEVVLLLGDDINLSMTATKTRLADAVAPLLEELPGCFLSQLTNFLAVHHPYLDPLPSSWLHHYHVAGLENVPRISVKVGGNCDATRTFSFMEITL